MNAQDTLNQLQWRYAVKAFDPDQNLSSDQVKLIKETLRLAPSSFGLQPWHFLFIESQTLRTKIQAKAWNQGQVTQASQFIVFCRPESLTDSHVTKLIETTANTRGTPAEKLLGYENVIKGFIAKHSDAEKAAWMEKQIYIALGGLMAVCALHGIDTCPMEGFDPQAVDEILGLKEKGLRSVVLCGLGFRAPSDKYAKAAKVRYPTDQVIETL